jgi:hypothetical protein
MRATYERYQADFRSFVNPINLGKCVATLNDSVERVKKHLIQIKRTELANVLSLYPEESNGNPYVLEHGSAKLLPCTLSHLNSGASSGLAQYFAQQKISRRIQRIRILGGLFKANLHQQWMGDQPKDLAVLEELFIQSHQLSPSAEVSPAPPPTGSAPSVEKPTGPSKG